MVSQDLIDVGYEQKKGITIAGQPMPALFPWMIAQTQKLHMDD
jgi:hypothetical protein